LVYIQYIQCSRGKRIHMHAEQLHCMAHADLPSTLLTCCSSKCVCHCGLLSVVLDANSLVHSHGVRSWRRAL
jgi:hypothetical protein